MFDSIRLLLISLKHSEAFLTNATGAFFMITRRQSLLVLPAFGLTGCLSNANVGGLVDAAKDSASAFTLTDDQVRAYAGQMVGNMDSQATIAPATSKYAKRLVALTEGAREDNGLPLNYKVYVTEEVNAFACADGSIRFYTGLMDMMTDDEIRYVVGHEMGHVASAHTKKRLQTALATSSAQKAAASSGNAAVSTLAQSELGELFAKVIMAQHSQSNEREADDYAFEFMSKRKYDRKATVTALEKFDKLSSGAKGSWLSTHPAPKERAERLRSKLV